MGLDPLYHTDPEHTQTLSLSDDSSSRKSRSNPLANIKSKMDLGESLSSHDLNMAHQHGDHGFYKQAHAYVHGGGMTKRRKQLGMDLDPNTDDKKKDEKENGEKKNIEKNKDSKENKTENTIGAEHELTGHLNGSQRLSTDSKSAFITTTTPEEKKKTQQVESDQTGNTVTQMTTVTDGVPESNTTNATDAKVKAEDKTVEGTKKDVSGVVDKKTGGVEEKKLGTKEGLEQVLSDELQNDEDKGKDEDVVKENDPAAALEILPEQEEEQVDIQPALTDLRQHAGQSKGNLAKEIKKQKKQIDTASGKEKAAIDKSVESEVSETGSHYDKEISSLQLALKQARIKANDKRKIHISNIEKNERLQQGNIKLLSKQKQLEMLTAGQKYHDDVLLFQTSEKNAATTKTNEQKATITGHAQRIVDQNIKSDRIGRIRPAVNDMRDDYNETLDDNLEDINGVITEDTNGLAVQFPQEAMEVAAKLPEGEGAALKGVADAKKEFVSQLNGPFTVKSFTDLDKKINEAIGKLRKAKTDAIKDIRDAGKQAKQNIDKQASQQKKQLDDQLKQNQSQVSEILSDTESDAPQLPGKKGLEFIAKAKEMISQTLVQAKVGGDAVVTTAKANMQKSSKQGKAAVRATAKQMRKNASDDVAAQKKNIDKSLEAILGSYAGMEKGAADTMQGHYDEYEKQLNSTILEIKGKWDEKIADGKKQIGEKNAEGLKSSADVTHDSLLKMVAEAERIKKETAWDRFWNVLGTIAKWVGYLLLAIAAIILIIVLLGPLLAGLIASLTTMLGGALALLLGEALGALVASFLIEAVGAYFIAKAVAKLGTNVYRAFFSDEEMSDKKRGDIVGEGIFDVGLSTFSLWKGAKSFFGGFKNMFQMTSKAYSEVRLASESGNLLNGSIWKGNWWGKMTAPLENGGIFSTAGSQISKGWTDTKTLWSGGWDKMKGFFNAPKPQVRPKVQSQPHAEFEEGYIYEKPYEPPVKKPDNGLSDRGYKPKPGERSQTKDDLYWDKKYKPGARNDNIVSGKVKTKPSTEQVSEWRSPVSKSDIGKLKLKALGDNPVKVDKGIWRSIDGKRQFRVVPDDYSWSGAGHGMGSPKVPGQSHVHIEFLRTTPNGNFVVEKNVHIPLY